MEDGGKGRTQLKELIERNTHGKIRELEEMMEQKTHEKDYRNLSAHVMRDNLNQHSTRRTSLGE